MFRLAVVLLFLSSCATVGFRIPNNRFLSPENSGNLGQGSASLGYGSKTYVIVSNGGRTTDAELLNSAELRDDDGIFVNAGISLHPVAELFLMNSSLGMKFQVLGQPASAMAPNNFSLALAIAGENGSVKTTNSLVGDLTYTLKGEAKYSGVDAMILAGFRTTANHLFYANIASNRYATSGMMTKEYTSGPQIGTSNALDLPKRNAKETSILFGWKGNTSGAYVMVETGFATASFDSTKPKDRFILGTTLGAFW